MKGTTVAVQGFGNVGSVRRAAAGERGCKVGGSATGLYRFTNKNGIDIDDAIAYVRSTRIRGLQQGRPT